MAAVSRAPTEAEKAELNTYVGSIENKREALEDVFWSMLNSKEFIFNH
jgi:exonuclease VII small subunit